MNLEELQLELIKWDFSAIFNPYLKGWTIKRDVAPPYCGTDGSHYYYGSTLVEALENAKNAFKGHIDNPRYAKAMGHLK